MELAKNITASPFNDSFSIAPLLASSIPIDSTFKHEFVLRITNGHCREKQKIYARTTDKVRTAAVKE